MRYVVQSYEKPQKSSHTWTARRYEQSSNDGALPIKLNHLSTENNGGVVEFRCSEV
jgi:hypothetical protein